ncbi:30S ribosomal protein S19 [Gammaproteobacteria bacterium]|nr:30S ribosomal protein S19 [Gammaproteobacteria bacterium]
MSRSKRKGPNVRVAVLDKMRKGKQSEAIKTDHRDCHIIPKMVGWTFLVHNGNKYIPVYITDTMIGHRLGEFAETRHVPTHAGDRKSKRA